MRPFLLLASVQVKVWLEVSSLPDSRRGEGPTSSSSMLAEPSEFDITYSGIGFPLPFSERSRAVSQLRDVASDFSIEVLPAPLLPMKTVIFQGISAAGEKARSSFENH